MKAQFLGEFCDREGGSTKLYLTESMVLVQILCHNGKEYGHSACSMTGVPLSEVAFHSQTVQMIEQVESDGKSQGYNLLDCEYSEEIDNTEVEIEP